MGMRFFLIRAECFTASSYKASRLPRLRFGQAESLFAERDALHQKGHTSLSTFLKPHTMPVFSPGRSSFANSTL